MTDDPRRTVHGELEEAAADLVQIIDGSVAQLWETIESLERLQPRNLERFRVSIFGSARIEESHPLYAEATELAQRLAEAGCDIITGGGGGLMQAVDQGASRGAVVQPADGDLPVRLVTDDEDAPFVERVFRHRTFFSRLHQFVRLSSAFIALPGGIGSTLEAMMVWQLLQAKHLPPTPFLLYGSHWRGLLWTRRWKSFSKPSAGFRRHPRHRSRRDRELGLRCCRPPHPGRSRSAHGLGRRELRRQCSDP
jgi:predicted Rossmann-fold nucleotide-binding protein